MSRFATKIAFLAFILPPVHGWSAAPTFPHEYIRIVETGLDKIVFEILPFEIDFTAMVLENQRYDFLSVHGFGLTIEPGHPIVPKTGALIKIPAAANVSVSILESSFEQLEEIDLAPAAAIKEDGIGGNITYQYRKDKTVYSRDLFWPDSLATFAGRTGFRDYEIGRVEINPVQYNPIKKSLRIYRSLRVEVKFSRPFFNATADKSQEPRSSRGIVDRFLLNSGHEDQKTPRLYKKAVDPFWYDPDATYYKLFIDEEGIYSLSFQDLEEAGVTAASLPLPRLKIILKGQQIPIWIEGPTGPTLGPENTIYFYGDQNRGADNFYDLFTDTDTYWFTSDGDDGRRYDLVTESLTTAEPDLYYWHTIHIEQDSIFFRWNGSSTLDLGEGWIWRYLFDDEKAQTPFKVSGLFAEAAMCSLKVRVQGTTRTVVDPDHHVQLSINNQVIGEAFFDDREELVFVTSFPSTLINDGTNRFELHLVPDTGAEINQILLDWVEIIYPRVHAAQGSQLKFQTTQNSMSPIGFRIKNLQDSTALVLDPASGETWQLKTEKASFYKVESAGFDDGNYLRLSFDFENYVFTSRGHNLVAIDRLTGEVESRSFDTYGSPVAADAMADFINSLADSTIVLAGIMDEGSRQMNERAYQALESLGSRLSRQVTNRDSWAFIGWKGAAPDSVSERLSTRFEGPAVVERDLKEKLAFRYMTSFQDTSDRDGFYYISSASALKKVKGIQRERNSNLRDAANGADYIVISHSNFQSEARRLAAYRQEHNSFRTAVVDVQDIFDEFNYGVVNPQAIKDFLEFAFSNWSPPAPSHVVLFGDASWDPKHIMSETNKTNFVPTYGDPVADNWFVTFSDPDAILPSMYLGRLPVETVEQARVVVDKIIAYESLSFDAWNKEIVFFNGGVNSIEQSTFRAQAAILISNYIESSPLGAKPTQFNKTTDEVITVSFFHDAIDKIQEGALWVNFLGHGGSSVWDISIGQPEDWNNKEIFPFVTGMSCHSSRFANPIINSLSEEYLINPMGAAAYWGSSGFGFITQDFFLLDGIFSAISAGNVRSLGEATTLAKFHVWQLLGDSVPNRMVINQYTLTGDPAMNLALSKKPELAVRSDEIVPMPSLLLTSDTTATVVANLRNYGIVPNDSVYVEFSITDPSGVQTNVESTTIAPFALQDSLDFDWRLPDVPGQYEIAIAVDPRDVIDEQDNSDNVASIEVVVHSSDLSLIKPLDFGAVSSSDFDLVAGNSRIQNNDLRYYFEIDTSMTFDSQMFTQSPPIHEGAIVTLWRPPVSIDGVYYWRVRTFDGANYGPWAASSFTFSVDAEYDWQQSETGQFGLGQLLNTAATDDETALKRVALSYRSESAGLLDGNYALLSSNKDIVGLNMRGHNLAVFDARDGEFLTNRSFDTWEDAANAEAMADFIDTLNEGDRVMVAIRDEGSRSMTEGAYTALESIGSSLTRQVGIRDSWAIIGRKGAAQGTVPEALKRSGEGPVSVADTLFRFSKSGQVVSTEIGPALKWSSAQFDYSLSSADEGMVFQVVGVRGETGSNDTLKNDITSGNQLSLADIDAQLYPKIKLIASLSSETGLSSPRLNSWSVDYDPPPDLVIGRGSIELVADTLDVGDDVDLNLKIGNFGLSPSDSFSVTLSTDNSGGDPVQLSRFNTPELAVDEIRDMAASFSTTDLSGRTDVRVTLDAEDSVTELHETNNDFTFTVWVAQDTVSPDIRVTFDGHVVAGGDFVASAPQVVVEIRDANNLAFEDTAQVSILLDENKVSYGTGPGQAQLLPQQNSEDRDLKAVSVFEPTLSEGDHKIEVLARDASGNLRYFQAEFEVSDRFVLANVMNYPNPFRGETDFTYILTQEADLVKLKIYTISGRLIQQFDILPTRAGFNQFHWDGRDADGDRPANGVYFYKIIAKQGEQQTEVIEKLVVMR